MAQLNNIAGIIQTITF